MQNFFCFCKLGIKFESFVNSERCKTGEAFPLRDFSLRALLIQKDAKLVAAFLSASTV